LLVDGREGLVHQQHLGIDGKRAGQSDALAHAAGKLVRIAVLEALQSDRVDVFLGDGLAFGFRDAPQFEPEGDVADGARPGQQRKILEHERPVGSGGGNRLPVNQNLAARRRNQPADDLEQGRLAAAGRPEEGCQLPLGKVDREIAQGFDVFVVLVDVADRNGILGVHCIHFVVSWDGRAVQSETSVL
jgi:hypothetical protein